MPYQYKFETLAQISVFVIISVIFFKKISEGHRKFAEEFETFLEVSRIFSEMLEGIADTWHTAAWLRKQYVDYFI